MQVELIFRQVQNNRNNGKEIFLHVGKIAVISAQEGAYTCAEHSHLKGHVIPLNSQQTERVMTD